jgi:hypothetical protein
MLPPFVSTKLIPLAQSAASVDHGAVRVFAEIVIRRHVNACRFERLHRNADVTRGHQPLVGNEQRALHCELARELSDAFDRTRAEDHSCARLEFKGNHLQ